MNANARLGDERDRERERNILWTRPSMIIKAVDAKRNTWLCYCGFMRGQGSYLP